MNNLFITPAYMFLPPPLSIIKTIIGLEICLDFHDMNILIVRFSSDF